MRGSAIGEGGAAVAGFDGADNRNGEDRGDRPGNPALRFRRTGIARIRRPSGVAAQPLAFALGAADTILSFLIFAFGGHGGEPAPGF